MPRMVHFWARVCTLGRHPVERVKSEVSGSAGIPTVMRHEPSPYEH